VAGGAYFSKTDPGPRPAQFPINSFRPSGRATTTFQFHSDTLPGFFHWPAAQRFVVGKLLQASRVLVTFLFACFLTEQTDCMAGENSTFANQDNDFVQKRKV